MTIVCGPFAWFLFIGINIAEFISVRFNAYFESLGKGPKQ